MPDQFHHWLAEHRFGRASAEWYEAMAAVVQAVHETKKPGSLTIKIKVEPKGRTVMLTDTVDAKVPDFDREVTIYYPDAAGGLHREDPAQGRLAVDDLDRKRRAAGEREEP
jgi:hypothetical protein